MLFWKIPSFYRVHCSLSSIITRRPITYALAVQMRVPSPDVAKWMTL